MWIYCSSVLWWLQNIFTISGMMYKIGRRRSYGTRIWSSSFDLVDMWVWMLASWSEIKRAREGEQEIEWQLSSNKIGFIYSVLVCASVTAILVCTCCNAVHALFNMHANIQMLIVHFWEWADTRRIKIISTSQTSKRDEKSELNKCRMQHPILQLWP